MTGLLRLISGGAEIQGWASGVEQGSLLLQGLWNQGVPCGSVDTAGKAKSIWTAKSTVRLLSL